MTDTIIILDDRRAQTSVAGLASCLRESFVNSKIRLADAEGFLSALAQNVPMAVLPGICGEDSAYPKILDGARGQKKIRDYISRGGILVTLCAGSYFIARKTEYTPPWGPKREQENIHPVFNALAKGPLNGIAVKPWGNNPMEGYNVVPVKYKDDTGKWRRAHISYGNGPALFLPPGNPQNVEIIARYRQDNQNMVAAAWLNEGKGAALWLGVLPHTRYFAHDPKAVSPEIANLLKNLKPHEQGRKAFWNSMMSRVRKRLDHTTAPGL